MARYGAYITVYVDTPMLILQIYTILKRKLVFRYALVTYKLFIGQVLPMEYSNERTNN